MEALKILYISAICLGMWTAIQLWIKTEGNRLANRLFSGFILLILVPCLKGFTFISVFSLPPIIITITHKFSWLYAPCLYLFLRVLLNQFNVNLRQLIHLIPFGLLGVAIVTDLYREQGWIAVATFVQITTYSWLSARLVYRHREQIRLLFQQFGAISLYWFAYLVLAVFVLLLFETYAIAAFMSWGGLSAITWHLFTCGFAWFVLSLAFFSIYQPQIFFAHNQTPEVGRSDTVASSCLAEINHLEEKRGGGIKGADGLKELTPEAADELQQELEALMKDTKPYLHNDLTLPTLAKRLRTSTHRLSELLNVHMRSSFYDYVNGARLEAAKLMLADHRSGLSILDIIYQSGFNNKSSFYRVFKENVGMSPSAYRAQCGA